MSVALLLNAGVDAKTFGASAPSLATVRDGVEMRTLAYQLYLDGAPPCGLGTDYGPLASFSPDGRQFVVVLRRGDLMTDVNQYTLVLWKTHDLGKMPPTVIVTMKSSSYYPGIDPGTISWDQNGRSLTFLGERPGGLQQIYEFNLESKKLRALTGHDTPIINYARSSNGTVMAYEAVGPAVSLWNKETMRHGLLVSGQSLLDVTYGKITEPWALTYTQLFIRSRRGIKEVSPLTGSQFSAQQGGLYERGMSMSPDGHHIVVAETVPNRQVPNSWREYSDPFVRLQMSIVGKGEGQRTMSRFSRLVLIDTRTGESRILLDSPIPGGLSRPVIWSPDGQSVIISDTLLPIDGRGGLEKRWRAERTTVEVSIRTGAVKQVSQRCQQALAWSSHGLTCLATMFSEEKQFERLLHTQVQKEQAGRDSCPATKLVQFRKIDGQWRAGESEPPTVDVFLKEDRNSPPKLYYRVSGEDRDKLLLDLNPRFAHLRLARERLVTWEWSTGQEITGGLYYPPNYRSGRRYPLVIQTHGFQSNRFAFWGEYPTSDAAQPLAARGMFVLQVNDIDDRLFMHPKTGQLMEAERAIKIYKSAIEYLSHEGLVDARRVGIIGFSHTCFLVDWALTHDPGLFAVASVAEGGDGSDMEYMLDLLNSVNVNSLYGGPPYGQSLKSWVKLSPIFNVDHVRAPLLIVVPHHQLALEEWEWLDGLRELSRPVEMVVLDGRTHDLHMLQEPWDISLVSGRNVDWFDFWLNGHEEPGPRSISQYRRWERLCRMQKSEKPAFPTACVSTHRALVRRGGKSEAELR